MGHSYKWGVICLRVALEVVWQVVALGCYALGLCEGGLCSGVA